MTFRVGMYHYVRPESGGRPRVLHFQEAHAFESDVGRWSHGGHLSTLDALLEVLSGAPVVGSSLLLTFDDGLVEHAAVASKVLRRFDSEGVFLIPTEAVEEHRLIDAHRTHLLMGALGADGYAEVVESALGRSIPASSGDVDPDVVIATYRWDSPSVGRAKYIVNYSLAPEVRVEFISGLFDAYLGDERACAEAMYVSWEQVREMERMGMRIGGHSHTHPVLASLDASSQRRELERCAELLEHRVGPHPQRPFAYPFGKSNTIDRTTVDLLRQLGFVCGFSTETGPVVSGDDAFHIRRLDPKDLVAP